MGIARSKNSHWIKSGLPLDESWPLIPKVVLPFLLGVVVREHVGPQCPAADLRHRTTRFATVTNNGDSGERLHINDDAAVGHSLAVDGVAVSSRRHRKRRRTQRHPYNPRHVISNRRPNNRQRLNGMQTAKILSHKGVRRSRAIFDSPLKILVAQIDSVFIGVLRRGVGGVIFRQTALNQIGYHLDRRKVKGDDIIGGNLGGGMEMSGE
nr:hypothetical protein Iba_chr10eCG14260 [Ipomoea batatas]